MLTHLRLRKRVGAWLDGALPETEARATAAHVAECARCQQLADDVRRVRDLVRVAVPTPAPPDWTGFWAGVVRRIEEDRNRQPVTRPAGWTRRLRRPLVAVPGALAAAVLLSLTLWQAFHWPAVPESAVIVRSAGTEVPGGTVMVYAIPEQNLAVVWLFEE